MKQKQAEGNLWFAVLILKDIPDERVVSKQLLSSMLNYMNSDSFNPQVEVDLKKIKELINKLKDFINSFFDLFPDCFISWWRSDSNLFAVNIKSIGDSPFIHDILYQLCQIPANLFSREIPAMLFLPVRMRHSLSGTSRS